MLRRLALLLLVLSGSLLSGGCASIRHDDWRFCISRKAYPELAKKMDANEPVGNAESFPTGGAMELVLLPLLLCLPLAVDLAALPVTTTRDALAD